MMQFFIIKIINFLPESSFFRIKVVLLNFIGNKIHKSSKISSSIKIYGKGKVTIGAETWIGPNVHFYVNDNQIIIGKYCDIAPDVKFVTGSHSINKQGIRKAGKGYTKPVKIGDGCWICFGAIIHSGTVLNDSSIVPSGEIVK